MGISSAQLRAARALLRWSALDLAKASKVGVATIRRIEVMEGLFQSPSPTRPRFELPWRPPAWSSSTRTVADPAFDFGSRQSRSGENRRRFCETNPIY